jgi:predicted nucleotide-binding protein
MALAMEPLVRGKINRAIDAVIDGGQTSCELLASSYAETLAMLPSQYQQTIAVYLETAKRLREGAAANSTILSPNEDQLHRMVPISSTQKIFVVHGRNEYYRQRVVNLLREWGCIPITLREQPNIGRTLIEKFEEHANADYAVVLLTADDKGALATERNHLPRPRQNVVFEMGYFIGRMTRERVCALYQEGVELPSDLAGIVYVPLDSNDQWQQVLLDELRAVGFDLKRQSELLVPVS